LGWKVIQWPKESDSLFAGQDISRRGRGLPVKGLVKLEELRGGVRKNGPEGIGDVNYKTGLVGSETAGGSASGKTQMKKKPEYIPHGGTLNKGGVGKNDPCAHQRQVWISRMEGFSDWVGWGGWEWFTYELGGDKGGAYY